MFRNKLSKVPLEYLLEVFRIILSCNTHDLKSLFQHKHRILLRSFQTLRTSLFGQIAPFLFVNY